MALESSVLKAKRFSQAVIQTMLKARKPSSARFYYQIWHAYLQLCAARSYEPRSFRMSRILAFLQARIDQGLCLTSLKVRVFRKIATLQDVRALFQGVLHIVSICTSDSSLGLRTCPQVSSSSPIRAIALGRSTMDDSKKKNSFYSQ